MSDSEDPAPDERRGLRRRGVRTPNIDQCPDEVFDVVEDALLDLWNVVDDLSRLRSPESRYYRVTIFGSSRMREGDEIYENVRSLARDLAAMGCDIVTGGGPGLMQAANEGEVLGDEEDRTRSYGLNIDLEHEEETNPFVEKAYTHRTFFSRLHHFVRLSDAFIVVRGGIGTSLEALMVWQLCQVRHLAEIPLVMVGEMWQELVDWAERNMLENGRPLADPPDMAIPRCVDTVDEAVEIVRRDMNDRETLARDAS